MLMKRRSYSILGTSAIDHYVNQEVRATGLSTVLPQGSVIITELALLPTLSGVYPLVF